MATKLGLPGPADATDDPEIRIGSLALKCGWVTAEQLREALAAQAREALSTSGSPRLLGAILVEQRFLSSDQLDRLLQQQRERRTQGQS